MKRIILVLASAALILPVVILAIQVALTQTRPRPAAVRVAPAQRPGYYLPPRTAPSPASKQRIAEATDFIRLKSTLRNYRIALASGNSRISERLRIILMRHQRDSVQLAREDLNRSQTGPELELAKRTLASLEN